VSRHVEDADLACGRMANRMHLLEARRTESFAPEKKGLPTVHRATGKVEEIIPAKGGLAKRLGWGSSV